MGKGQGRGPDNIKRAGILPLKTRGLYLQAHVNRGTDVYSPAPRLLGATEALPDEGSIFS
jgi:hypothetical protein